MADQPSSQSSSARYVVREESTRNLPVEAQRVSFVVWDTHLNAAAQWGTQVAVRGNHDGVREAREEAEHRAALLNEQTRP